LVSAPGGARTNTDTHDTLICIVSQVFFAPLGMAKNGVGRLGQDSGNCFPHVKSPLALTLFQQANKHGVAGCCRLLFIFDTC